MIKVVSFKICPFVQRVTASLEARSIPYEIDYISLKNPPAWFKTISPNEQVPLLITDSNTVLFESDAIVEYLDEAYGQLQNSITPEQQATHRAWSYQASKHYLTQCRAMRSPNAKTLESRSEPMTKAFSRIEQVLSDTPFFHGETVGKVDIAWLPLLHRAAIVQKNTNYNLLKHFPNVIRWQSALMATGLAEKSVAEDFDAEFTAFYLSNDTYLGRGTDCSEASSDDCCGSTQCCG